MNNETSFPDAMVFGEFPEFRASPLIRGGHLQTIASAFAPFGNKPGGTRNHLIDTTQGDQLVLHEDFPACGDIKRREVLLLHGLGGSYASPYMIRIAAILAETGHRVWRLDLRGCGAGIQLARHHAHAGRIEDLDVAVRWIENRTCNHSNDSIGQDTSRRPLTIVGFSLGGNLLLKWLAAQDSGKRQSVDSAIAVAPPVDLAVTSHSLNFGLGRWYDWYFGKVLKQRLVERRKQRPDIFDTGVHPIPGKLKSFDAAFTAPLGGFSSVDDYYERCSSGGDLHRIQTPTLVLFDHNDPVVPFGIYSQFRLGSGIRLVETCGGGHLGYIARPGSDKTWQWMDWRIHDWVSQLGDAMLVTGR